ncbi:MAG: TonB-dependent receptor [Capnocytophaga sp.]|nr:TonB-dependent receptor [Capnocytophaga sp.]
MFRKKYYLSAVFFMLAIIAFAQNNRIKGKILDENKFPVANASVQLQSNSKIKTLTDNDGSYSLIFTEENPVIEVEKEGFQKKIIPVTLQNNENRVTYVEVVISKNAIELEEVVVSDNPSLVANSVHISKMKLDKIAGGTNLADLKNLSSQRSQTLKDALQREPGVIIQEFFGGNDQPRLNIRGSGIQSNPQSRGVALFQDGIPINFSDGSYIIGVLEPQASNLVEVYRGSNAMEYGGATLGGAMNFVTKNGYNASPLSVKMEAGSFNYFNSSISSGFSFGKNDIFVSTSYNHSDGYREYNSSKRFNALLNAGRKFSDKFESRIYASFTDLRFDIPGPLTRYQYEEDRKQINQAPKLTTPFAFGPNVLRDKPNRESKIARFGNKNAYQINKNNLLTTTLYYQYADDVFTFPMGSNIRQNINNDYGLRLNYEYNTIKNNLTAGVHISQGRTNQSYFINNRGNRDNLFSKEYLTANHLSIFVNDTYSFTNNFSMNLALQANWDTRKVEDKYTDATRPVVAIPLPQPNQTRRSTVATNYINADKNYFGINPKIGFILKSNEITQFFANFSGSYEPPTFLELINLSGGTINSSANRIEFSELDAQKAYTIEIGTKGNLGKAFVWNISLYNSWVDKEILALTDELAIVGKTINSPSKTIHQGVEAGLQSTFLKNIFSKKEDSFTLFVNYNYSNFYFTDGNIYKNKKLGGVPTHYIFAALDYKHPSGLFLEVNLESIPEKTPTDHQNTLYQDPYSLLGAKIGFKKNKWTFFVQGNNLTNKVYASSYLVRDIATAPQFTNPATGVRLPTTPENFTTFIPGLGTNIIGGLTFTW